MSFSRNILVSAEWPEQWLLTDGTSTLWEGILGGRCVGTHNGPEIKKVFLKTFTSWTASGHCIWNCSKFRTKLQIVKAGPYIRITLLRRLRPMLGLAYFAFCPDLFRFWACTRRLSNLATSSKCWWASKSMTLPDSENICVTPLVSLLRLLGSKLHPTLWEAKP